jgi:acetyltransferase-like isoleucine patch superfamily enzyme
VASWRRTWLGPTRVGAVVERLAPYRAGRRWPTAAIEPGVIIRGNLDNLVLGDRVNLQRACFVHLGGMDWCQNTGLVAIGADGVVSPGAVIYGCGPGGVRVGDRFDCGPGVNIFASRTDYKLLPRGRLFAPVVIGDDVVIFANAVITPGVTVGDGAVIAAASVVLNDVPPHTLVAGAPAHVVRRLDEA